MGQDPQRFFVQPPALPDDALGHEALARKLVGHAARLPPGSSIALQGPWGRGKTDVLWRIHTAAEQAEPIDGTRFVASIHINPWSYGEPDLLTPLVIKLLELIPPTRRANDKSIRMAAQTVIKSGLNFGMKAASYLVPAGGKLLEVAADPMSDLLAGLFEARDEQDNGELPDLDPVAAMRTRFCELCSAVVEAASDSTSDGRLLVVVDDLDRCLPSRQIALLEAVYFLANSSAGEAEIPPVNFVFAVDGLAVSRVVRRMFSASMMESQAYIDKLFDFKMHLAEMPNGAVSSLLRGRTPSRGLADAIDNALFLPSIRTARFAIRLAVASRAVLDDSQLSLEYSLEGNHNDQ
ncbi:MAG: P-loop NTPase fold protein, partial [Planctomycetota bacterium]